MVDYDPNTGRPLPNARRVNKSDSKYIEAQNVRIYEDPEPEEMKKVIIML